MNTENNSLERTYFIGGPPRVGKSAFAYRLAKELQGHVVSTDSIREAVKKACNNKDGDLFVVNKHEGLPEEEWLAQHLERPLEVVEYQNKESIALWPSIVSFCNTFVEDSETHIVEGVAILPSLVASMKNAPKHVVFVGNTDKTAGVMTQYMEKFPEQDWMASMNYSKDRIEGMASFVRAMSQYFKGEAQKYGFPYYDISSDNFENSIQNIIKEISA